MEQAIVRPFVIIGSKQRKEMISDIQSFKQVIIFRAPTMMHFARDRTSG